MVIKELNKKVTDFLKKNKFVIVILLVGILLMCLPGKENSDTLTEPEQAKPVKSEKTVSLQLAEILSKVKGAGEVEVLLTIASGEQVFYQADKDETNSSDGSSSRYTTVTVSDSQKNEFGLINQTIPPVYKGAIIICQGADDPQICLQIVNAVAKVTGLGADKISVLKMK